VQERRSFPVRVEQVVRSDAEKAASKAKAAAKKVPPSTATRRPGRPKGSKNKAKAEATLTPELGRIKGMIDALLHLIAPSIPLISLVLDGHFGNHNALPMARQCHVHLISTLRADSALYWPYAGPYGGRGPRRKDGRKVDDGHIPQPSLQETTVEGHIQTCIYQAQVLHKAFSQALHVVIIVQTNLHTQVQAHVVLFSSDLALASALLVDSYAWRFQLECNFRDAKQYGGLEAFMNVTPTGVINAANLSLFMVNVSSRLLRDFRQDDPEYSILDLKASCRGYKYVDETIQMLPEKPEPVLLAQIFHTVAGLGRIHNVQPAFIPS